MKERISHSFKPAALRGPYDGVPVFDEYKRKARECLIWHMSPEYWDAMSHIEYMAWHEAWAELQEEGASKE